LMVDILKNSIWNNMWCVCYKSCNFSI
jgi:hypothetical protein